VKPYLVFLTFFLLILALGGSTFALTTRQTEELNYLKGLQDSMDINTCKILMRRYKDYCGPCQSRPCTSGYLFYDCILTGLEAEGIGCEFPEPGYAMTFAQMKAEIQMLEEERLEQKAKEEAEKEPEAVPKTSEQEKNATTIANRICWAMIDADPREDMTSEEWDEVQGKIARDCQKAARDCLHVKKDKTSSWHGGISNHFRGKRELNNMEASEICTKAFYHYINYRKVRRRVTTLQGRTIIKTQYPSIPSIMPQCEKAVANTATHYLNKDNWFYTDDESCKYKPDYFSSETSGTIDNQTMPPAAR
jgi:hypothetical protein